MSKKSKKMVEVLWEDSAAASDGFWASANKTMKPVIIHTVGYIHERTKKRIVLVSGWHTASGGNVSGMECIPSSAIRKVRKLRAVQKRRPA